MSIPVRKVIQNFLSYDALAWEIYAIENGFSGCRSDGLWRYKASLPCSDELYLELLFFVRDGIHILSVMDENDKVLLQRQWRT